MDRETGSAPDELSIPSPGALKPMLPGMTIHFNFNVGEYVEVKNRVFTGIVKCAAVYQTRGIIYLIDDGVSEQWWAQDLVRPGRLMHGTKPETFTNATQVDVGENTERTVNNEDLGKDPAVY